MRRGKRQCGVASERASDHCRLIEPERVDSVSQALWWALSRATAMADGGVALTTFPSHVIEMIVAISGLAFLSLITAAIATLFFRSHASQASQLPVAEILERLERIEARLNQATRAHGTELS